MWRPSVKTIPAATTLTQDHPSAWSSSENTKEEDMCMRFSSVQKFSHSSLSLGSSFLILIYDPTRILSIALHTAPGASPATAFARKLFLTYMHHIGGAAHGATCSMLHSPGTVEDVVVTPCSVGRVFSEGLYKEECFQERWEACWQNTDLTLFWVWGMCRDHWVGSVSDRVCASATNTDFRIPWMSSGCKEKDFTHFYTHLVTLPAFLSKELSESYQLNHYGIHSNAF